MTTISAKFTSLSDETRGRADRIGVFASVLCAIHCIVTPPLLIALPVFGKAWAHPASHWGMALLVVPLAIFALRHGYRLHARKWIVVVGSFGILAILIGAVLPYFPSAKSSSTATSDCSSCCPSIQSDAATDKSRLVIPAASIVTTLGGIALVICHIANLSCCTRRRSDPDTCCSCSAT